MAATIKGASRYLPTLETPGLLPTTPPQRLVRTVGLLRTKVKAKEKDKVTKDLLAAKVMPARVTRVAEDGDASSGILAGKGGKLVRSVTSLPVGLYNCYFGNAKDADGRPRCPVA